MNTKVEGMGVSVCPGPNMAYFSKIMSLKEMTSHIYGGLDMLNKVKRPHMFIKELDIYIDFLKNRITETKDEMTVKQERFLQKFSNNIENGITYYNGLFTDLKGSFNATKSNILTDLAKSKDSLLALNLKLARLKAK